jgi:phosphoribosylglycinamide formyltransferase-1
MFNIAIFASGAGSNAEKIIQYFRNREDIGVGAIVSNRTSAGVLKIAEKEGVESRVFSRNEFSDNPLSIVEWLREKHIDFVVLAGFLLRVPNELIDAYEGRMVNIHPALLPEFGGKGMYGDHVHRSVLEAGRKVSGITIHLVDEQYDHGEIILQEEIEIDNEETLNSLKAKIQKLEHFHYPRTIEKLIQRLRP